MGAHKHTLKATRTSLVEYQYTLYDSTHTHTVYLHIVYITRHPQRCSTTWTICGTEKFKLE